MLTSKQILLGVYLYCNGDFSKCMYVLKNNFDVRDYCSKHIDLINALEPLTVAIIEKEYPYFLKELMAPPIIIFKSTAETLNNFSADSESKKERC